MRIAVTGAGGFVGSHLVPHLRREGHEVLPLRRTPDGTSFEAADDRQSKPHLATLLEGVSAIVHLAARQQDAPSTPLVAYLPSNVVLTESLLGAASASGVQRFVLASSRMVYPSSVDGAMTEDCCCVPDSFYGLSKRIAEDLVTMFAARGPMSGVSLRLSQVYGDGDRGRGILPRFIEAVRSGEPPTVIGSGSAVRDFVHVDDVANAFTLALDRRTTVPAINIGGGGRSVLELATAVAHAAGMEEAAITFAPAEADDTSRYSLDTALAQRELGWVARRDLVAAIRERLSRGRSPLDDGAGVGPGVG